MTGREGKIMTYRTSYKKYGNRRTEYNGVHYDSKFEASIAEDLDLRKKAGEIKDWERQFKIECMPYDVNGKSVPQCKVTHKVDFRVHENSGDFTLLEAKGPPTDDWKRRVKWLEFFWLPAHPDHEYQVIYNR